MQRHYDRVHLSKDLQLATLDEIEFLTKLYKHSLLTNKLYLLKPFVEERFYTRVLQFKDFVEETGFKLRAGPLKGASEAEDTGINAKGLEQSLQERIFKCRLKEKVSERLKRTQAQRSGKASRSCTKT